MPNRLLHALQCFWLLAAAAAFSACAALPNSNQHRGEKLTLRVVERPKPLAFVLQPQVVASRGLELLLMGRAVSLTIDGIQSLIRREQARYSAEYHFNQSNLYFYDNPSVMSTLDPQNIRFGGLIAERQVQIGGRHDTAHVTALRVKLDMMDDAPSQYALLNNSVIRLRVGQLHLASAKAKVPAANWYLPWTLPYRQHLNIDLTVRLLGSWIGPDGTIRKNEPLGTALLRLRDVPLADTAALRAYEKKQAGRILDGYFHLVPRSNGSYIDQNNNLKPSFGQGVYSAEVVVTESGKTLQVNQLIYDSAKGALKDATPYLLPKTK